MASSHKLLSGSLTHKAFEIGIFTKALDGVLQTLGGLLLWFLSPDALNGIAHALLQHAGSLPSDMLDGLLQGAQHFATTGKMFAAAYLFSHGVVKIAIIIALWLNKLWAYPLALVVFSGFIVYQCYRYTFTHSIWLIWLTVFDALVVYLTWLEYKEQKAVRANTVPAVVE